MKNLLARRVISIVGYVIAVGFNIPHLVDVYVDAVHIGTAGSFEWLFIIVIDFGILVLALYDREGMASTFATLILFINLYFYWAPLPFPSSYNDWISLLPGAFFSPVPAFFVNFFSVLIADQFSETFTDNSEKLHEVSIELENVRVKYTANREELAKIRPVLETYMNHIGSVVRVNSTKAKIHNCGAMVVAGSNREETQTCVCGEIIKW